MIYTIDEIKKCIEPIAEKYHLKAVYIFGSYARGEASDDSNIDILIDREGSIIKSAFDMGGLYEDLSSYLGKEIGLITLQTLEQKNTQEQTPWFVQNVRSEMIKIWGEDNDLL